MPDFLRSTQSAMKEKRMKEIRRSLTLVTLSAEQIAKAKQANGPRRRITHALVCGPYGQMFGTEKQCLKYFEAWRPDRDQPIFPELFKKAVKTGNWKIAEFEGTDNLVIRLIEAQDKARG